MTPNERIALAISLGREEWAWAHCPRGVHFESHRHDGALDIEVCGRVGTGTKLVKCPTCHGAGRVPVALEKQAFALPLVEWAAKQTWWDNKATGTWGKRNCTWRDRANLLLWALTAGNASAGETSRSLRDLVSAALEEETT